MLWSKLQKGDLTEAGAPSPLLRAAKAAQDRGEIQSRQDLIDFAQKWTPARGGGPGKSPTTIAPAGIDSLQQRLQTLGDDALDRVRKSGAFEGRIMPSLFPADVMKDMATWGAARIANGAIDFGKWSKAMLDDASDISPQAMAKVRAMLPQLYQASQKEYEHHAQK